MSVRHKTALSIVGTLLALYGCSDNSSGPESSDNNPAGSLSFAIGIGESRFIEEENLKVTFTEVLDDSRCPANAYCVWAGISHVEFRLIKNETDTAYAVPAISGNTMDSSHVSELAGEALGYRIELYRLDPYPVDYLPTDPSEYSASIRVVTVEESTLEDVIMTDLPPVALQLDPFELEAASVDGDILTISVQYGGGCRDHLFKMYMSPAAFLDTLPLQAHLYPRHNSNGDACEALITESVSFNLDPIRQLLDSQYRSGDAITLKIFEYFENTSAQFLTVTWYPD